MSEFSFNATVRGAMHIQHNIECQDASGSASLLEARAYAFAVADGHGDPACMRSAHGSKVAVKIALQLLQEFVSEFQERPDIMLNPELRDAQFRDLARNVVSAWKNEVTAHYRSHPLTQDQWDSLNEAAQTLTHERPEHAYGTTLIAGVALPEVLLLMQQGDGFCVVLDETGDASFPIPEDERCLGNMTTSLCDTDAEHHIRIAAIDLQDKGLCGCFVGSDGVDKSLRGKAALCDFCTEVALDSLGSSNAESMRAVVSPSLTILSEQGSGDDASLAGYVDALCIASCAKSLLSVHERYSVENERAQLKERLNAMHRMHDWYEHNSSQDDDEEELQERERFYATYGALQSRLAALQDAQTVSAASSAQRLGRHSNVRITTNGATNGNSQTVELHNSSQVEKRAVHPVSAPVSTHQQPPSVQTGRQAHSPRSVPAKRQKRTTLIGVLLLVLGLAVGTTFSYMALTRALNSEAPSNTQEDVGENTRKEESLSSSSSDNARGGTGAVANKNLDEQRDEKEEDQKEEVITYVSEHYARSSNQYSNDNRLSIDSSDVFLSDRNGDYYWAIVFRPESEDESVIVIVLRKERAGANTQWEEMECIGDWKHTAGDVTSQDDYGSDLNQRDAGENEESDYDREDGIPSQLGDYSSSSTGTFEG